MDVTTSSSTSSNISTKTKSKWKSKSYPYKTDYNDHFETPLRAYEDILPLLDMVGPQNIDTTTTPISASTGNTNKRQSHILYDPYYCDGQTIILLNKLNFQKIIHAKRDFYKDMKNNSIPPEHYHTFITNPPYSTNHKERCIEYAIKQLKEHNKSFFLLMPNYVATKDYFSRLTQTNNVNNQLLYVIPNASYQYIHPEGTGHTISPFDSIWFCGVSKDIVTNVMENKSVFCAAGNVNVRIFSTIDELKSHNLVPTMNRLNPSQRRKRKKKLLMSSMGKDDGHQNSVSAQKSQQNESKNNKQKLKVRQTITSSSSGNATTTCGDNNKMQSKNKKNKKKRSVENNNDANTPKKKKKKRY